MTASVRRVEPLRGLTLDIPVRFAECDPYGVEFGAVSIVGQRRQIRPANTHSGRGGAATQDASGGVGRKAPVELAARHHRLHVTEIEDLGLPRVVLVDQEEGR